MLSYMKIPWLSLHVLAFTFQTEALISASSVLGEHKLSIVQCCSPHGPWWSMHCGDPGDREMGVHASDMETLSLPGESFSSFSAIELWSLLPFLERGERSYYSMYSMYNPT